MGAAADAPPDRLGTPVRAGRGRTGSWALLVLLVLGLLASLAGSPALAQTLPAPASTPPGTSAGPGTTTSGAATTGPATTGPATSGAATTGAGPAGPEKINGILRTADGPLAGITVSVEQAGRQVTSVKTDASGRFSLPVPGAGDYLVRIDKATLPKGADLQQDTRMVTVRTGATAGALFRFGSSTRVADTRLQRAPQLLLGGFQFGLVLAMGAIGLSLIYGTTGLTNFAHGEIITGGALLGYIFNVKLGLNLIPATLIAVVVGGLLGGLLDRGLWRPLRRRGTGLIAALVVSIGLSLALRATYLLFYGGGQSSYLQYATQSPLTFGPVTILKRDMVIIVVTLVVLIGIGLGLGRTRLGKATRAVADNPSLAASSGIDVERVINVVWIAGTGLAVLGGVFLALSQQVFYQLGQNVLLLLFAGVTLGGLGTAYGALVGSLVIGIFTQLSTLFIPAELSVVGALVVLILILIVRPQGILGRAERVG